MVEITEPKRYYLHGDIVEDKPETFYDARADAFCPLKNLEPITPLDIERIRYQLSRPGKTVPKNYTRPDDPPNLFVGHELMSVTDRKLKALVREYRSQHGNTLRSDQ